VECAILVAMVVLWVLGSMVPTGHTVPQEIAALRKRPRLYLPYTTDAIKTVSRISARWRVERVALDTDALTQHFVGFNGSSSN
jgi:hypothetical protein